MRRRKAVVIDPHRERRRNDASVVLYADLPFWKAFQKTINRAARPGAAKIGVDEVLQLLELLVVRRIEVTQTQ